MFGLLIGTGSLVIGTTILSRTAEDRYRQTVQSLEMGSVGGAIAGLVIGPIFKSLLSSRPGLSQARENLNLGTCLLLFAAISPLSALLGWEIMRPSKEMTLESTVTTSVTGFGTVAAATLVLMALTYSACKIREICESRPQARSPKCCSIFQNRFQNRDASGYTGVDVNADATAGDEENLVPGEGR
jgi:hypothetical protein